MRGRILILETDPRARDELELALAAQGYEIACAAEAAEAVQAARAGEHERERAASRRPVVAASPAMISLLEAIERLAVGTGPVVLMGEAGSGRESLARFLHTQSPGRTAPFVVLDPEASDGGRSAILLARGGTLYVDGLESVPLPLQAMLRSVVVDGKLDVPGEEKPRPIALRLVVATTRRLARGVAIGALERPLADALDAAVLEVPPLRERRQDLPLLIDHLLARAAATLGCPTPIVSADALARLVSYPWPGNLLELESAMLRGALHAVAGAVSVRELPDELARSERRPGESSLALKPARKEFEADWIRRALRAASGNRTHASRLLEISHRALLYKLKEFGIRD